MASRQRSSGTSSTSALSCAGAVITVGIDCSLTPPITNATLHFLDMFRVFLGSLLVIPAFSQAPIRGFGNDQWKSEHEREEKALAIPQRERMKIYMERMASKPHHAGSAGSRAVAEYALGLFKEWGFDARIET